MRSDFEKVEPGMQGNLSECTGDSGASLDVQLRMPHFPYRIISATSLGYSAAC